MHPEEFVRLISTTPIVLSDEKSVQEEMSRLLDLAGVNHKREVALGMGDIVDFMLEGGTAVEVKLKAPKRAIYRQCERYCAHGQVKALVLVSATVMGLPPEIRGKPCWLASLGMAWL